MSAHVESERPAIGPAYHESYITTLCAADDAAYRTTFLVSISTA
jgi:hypothetical protein